MTTNDLKKRREESREAAATLKATLANRNYATLYKQYESKLASDDPYEAWLAREILAAYRTSDWERLVRAKNKELLHLEWLPNRRVRIMWPVPVPLTVPEMMILGYRRSNLMYLTEDDLCFGFEVHDRDYFDFCAERMRCERDRPENADNPES